MRVQPALPAVAMLLAVAACAPTGRSGATTGRIALADAMQHLALGDTVRARAGLELARWELPDEAAAWAALAQLDQAAGTIEGRVQARRRLLRAVDLAPEVAAYRIALGDLLRRQRFLRTGNRMLAEAVRLDPGAGDGWKLLGQAMLETYLDQPESEAERDSAIACYERALAANPHDLQTIEALALLALHQRRFDRARALLEPVVHAGPCTRQALVLVAVEFRAGRDAPAEALLQRALDGMTWEQREPYVGLRFVMHPNRVWEWNRLTSAQRDSAAREFWWSRDPTPASLRNERLLEHVTRVVEADWYFRVPELNKPGWQTDRGEMYQRYGPPEFAHRVEPRSWEWVYGRGRESTSFLFTDRYLNGDYRRLRRGAGSDYSRLELCEAQPEATRLDFEEPRGWQHAVHMFRGHDGRTAVDFTFVLQPERTWDATLVEAAAWRGPERRVHVERYMEATEFFRLSNGLVVGRLRMQVPPEPMVLAVQAAGLAGGAAQVPVDGAMHSVWLAGGRDSVRVADLHADVLALSDLVLAHHVEPGRGGLFDLGGIRVVPRVDTRIDTDQMVLYFEVYPPSAVLAAHRPLVLRYAVRSLAPRRFRFWDQFNADARARSDPARRPAVDARFAFMPRQAVERRDLVIDVGHLEDGAYALTVQVVDAETGQAAARTIEFDLDRAATLGAVSPPR